MHVTFISECEGRGIKRTRAVLDSYANRVGSYVWQSPITQQALKEIYATLRRRATRQMAVACYVNSGHKRMRLLWTVGSKKKFGRNGEVAIATKSHPQKNQRPVWANIAATIASLSGYAHDFGKSSKYFAEKITPGYKGPASDPIRHEIISAVILKRMYNENLSWTLAWSVAGGMRPTQKVSGQKGIGLLLEDGIQNGFDAILYCVSTHHKLFFKGTLEKHVAERGGTITLTNRNTSGIEKLANKVIKEIHEFQTSTAGKYSPEFWHGITWIARAAVILSDHKVSADLSQPWTGDPNDSQTVFANTMSIDPKKIKGVVYTSAYNQMLVIHLSKIGLEANKMLHNMITMKIPSISEQTSDTLTQKAPEQYKWQNKAASSLTPETPTLVMNIAATGAGKTKMNARCVATLAGNKPLAFTVILPLRSLTVQTGEAYSDDLGIGKDELSVVMGGTTTMKLAAYEKSDDITQKDIDDIDDVDDEIVITPELQEIPQWLEGSVKNMKSAKAVLMSPILVSTADTIIKAGDPSKQGNHATAMLRVMHADLIVDEIDGYEPKSLAAVLRLVYMAALFGRNVVVSSGTMTSVIANFVWQSYAEGHAVFNEMNKTNKPFECVIIDDSVAPSKTKTDRKEDFAALYEKHLNSLQEAIALKPITKKAKIAPIALVEKNEAGIIATIKNSSQELHDAHAWRTPCDKPISFGLVRIANIKQAIKVAEELAKEQDVFVCCYHSRHLVTQRYNIESNLDKTLKRKGPNWKESLFKNKDIQRCVNDSTEQVRIIIVATPVEEVGRDHDFDWAVIEPSSTQSIVQCAGRVNRHRKNEVKKTNVHILQYNFKAVNGREKDAFVAPGYQTEIDYKNSHNRTTDMLQLINNEKIQERLDSSLRFDTNTHKFSAYDSLSIENSLQQFVLPFVNRHTKWMNSDFYKDTALRDKQDGTLETWKIDGNTWFIKERQAHSLKDEWVPRNADWNIEPSLKGLFTQEISELRNIAFAAGIYVSDGMAVQVYHTEKKTHVMTKFGVKEI